MLSADNIAQYVRSSGGGFRCFWLEHQNSRGELCREIEALVTDPPILAVPVEAGQFADANGITDDIHQVLEEERLWFDDRRRRQILATESFALILVSRRSLGLPQISSPVELPDWFPAWPSRLITVTIQVITDLVDVPLDDRNVPIDKVRRGLFSLETALSRRIANVLALTPAQLEPLYSRLKAISKSPNANIADDLARAVRAQADVSAPESFRPGGGIESDYIISKLFRLWWKSSPEDFHSLAADVSSALCLSGSLPAARQFSFSSLLTRTNSPPLAKTPDGIVFSRTMVVSLANGMQLSTACAHAGDYPRYPANLIRAFSLELAHSCEKTAAFLDDLAGG